MSDDEYNGWTNRETWAVHLYITNDQGFADYVNDTYKAIKHARTVEYAESQCLTVIPLADSVLHSFEDWLQGHFEELQETPYKGLKQETITMLMDIGSLWRVNWDEVAQALIGDK